MRRKLLKGVSASEALEEAPVQVSAADSWGFPDIDLCFFYPGAVVHLLLLLSVTDAFSRW